MPKIDVEVDLSKLLSSFDAIDQRIKEATPRFLHEAGKLVEAEMKSLATRRTGFLAASIATKQTLTSVRVKPHAKYAPFVELGARPHTIFAKRARALRFTAGGKTVLARSVRHPGSRGRFFVRKTAEIVKDRLRELAVRIFGEAVAVK